MRFDVQIRLTQVHNIVVEAETAEDAQAAALREMGSRAAEQQRVEIDVEMGVR